MHSPHDGAVSGKTTAEYHFNVPRQDAQNGTRSSWRKWLLLPLIPLLPLYLVLLVPFIASLYAGTEAQRRTRAWRLRRTMQRAARITAWADIEAQLASGVGTILVDGPWAGWADTDIWWTPESVTQRAATEGIAQPKSVTDSNPSESEARMQDLAFDRWCQARYFDAACGVAKLVHTSHSHRGRYQATSRIERLKSAFPTLEYVQTNTWMVRKSEETSRHDKR